MLEVKCIFLALCVVTSTLVPLSHQESYKNTWDLYIEDTLGPWYIYSGTSL